MAEHIQSLFGPRFLSLLGKASGPGSLGYWIGYHSLALEVQVAFFLLTFGLIVWKHPEMGNRQMVVAGTVAFLSLAAFLWVGFTVPTEGGHAVCMLLNGLQMIVSVSLLIHRQIRTSARF